MQSYRLLFLDLDGTLIDQAERISPRALAALHAAQERGCVPVICTGRSRYKTRGVARQIGGPTLGIHFNGTILHDWERDRTLHRISLSQETAVEATRILHRLGMPPMFYGTEEEDRWVHVDRRVPPPAHYAAENPERLVWVNDLERDMPAAPVSIETYGSAGQAAALRAAWRQAFGDHVCIYEWSSPPNGGQGLHIHSAKANKAVAAQAVCDRLGVPRERAMAIGDHINDVELLRWAGFGVCMGDGHPDARACADHVTGCFADDGAAAAIERYVLGRQ